MLHLIGIDGHVNKVIMLLDSVLPTVELLSELELVLSNLDAALSVKFNLSFQQSSQHLHEE